MALAWANKPLLVVWIGGGALVAGAPGEARAAPQDAAARRDYTSAVGSAAMGQLLDAEKTLRAALGRCGAKACSPSVKAELKALLGAVLIQQKKTDEGKISLDEAVSLDGAVRLPEALAGEEATRMLAEKRLASVESQKARKLQASDDAAKKELERAAGAILTGKLTQASLLLGGLKKTCSRDTCRGETQARVWGLSGVAALKNGDPAGARAAFAEALVRDDSFQLPPALSTPEAAALLSAERAKLTRTPEVAPAAVEPEKVKPPEPARPPEPVAVRDLYGYRWTPGLGFFNGNEPLPARDWGDIKADAAPTTLPLPPDGPRRSSFSVGYISHNLVMPDSLGCNANPRSDGPWLGLTTGSHRVGQFASVAMDSQLFLATSRFKDFTCRSLGGQSRINQMAIDADSHITMGLFFHGPSSWQAFSIGPVFGVGAALVNVEPAVTDSSLGVGTWEGRMSVESETRVVARLLYGGRASLRRHLTPSTHGTLSYAIVAHRNFLDSTTTNHRFAMAAGYKAIGVTLFFEGFSGRSKSTEVSASLSDLLARYSSPTSQLGAGVSLFF